MSFYFGIHQQCGFAFSLSHDPFLNLGFEEWLLREGMKEWGINHLLFLYRNGPCVISGRFQVPWKEVNFKSPFFKNIQYVRRKSGGGTVYHDLGNWNYCFFHRGKDLKREENLQTIRQAVRTCGVVLDSNERYDLLCSQKKVSGSAFKQTKDYCYHHGTLLIEAKLKELKGLLGPTEDFSITGKGIASVPSPVANLRDYGFQGEFSDFIQICCRQFAVRWESVGPTPTPDKVLSYAQELQSSKWRWLETPKHTLAIGPQLILEIEKGKIISTNLFRDKLEGLELFSLTNLDGFGAELKAQTSLCQDLSVILLKNPLYL